MSDWHMHEVTHSTKDEQAGGVYLHLSWNEIFDKRLVLIQDRTMNLGIYLANESRQPNASNRAAPGHTYGRLDHRM